jgi:hypothetical protein
MSIIIQAETPIGHNGLAVRQGHGAAVALRMGGSGEEQEQLQ